MRKTKHWLVTASLLLCSVMANADNIASGICGSNLTWKLSDTGELIIDGSGAMGNYTHSYGNYAPWNEYRNSIKTVTILEGVTSVGERAFGNCIYLTAITIPESVTNIGYGAFMECSRLTSINIPEGVKSIGNYAFEDCTSLTSITIPEGVTSIGAGAFYNCSSLTSIAIPEGVTSIGDYTFYGCSGLTSFIIPNSVTSIGMYAFRDCNLAVVVIGENVTSINGSAFQYGCNSIHTVINYSTLSISKGTSNAGYVAYYAMRVLNGKDLTFVGDYFFSTKNGTHYLEGYMGNDTELTLLENYYGENYLIANYCFYKCTYLTFTSIPESVTSIGNNAFYGCTNLTEITLHSNPTIGTSAIPTTTKVSLVLDDSKAIDLNISNANTFDEVIYNRELGAGQYGTIMLPFAPDAESLENFAFYALKSVDGETLIFDEVASPVANTPYLYTLREGKSATQITGGETTISPTIVVPEVGGWQTIGSFTNQTVDCSAGDAYYYAINSADYMLYNVVSKMHVKPYRAYFKGSATNAAQLRIRTRDGGETLIDAAEVEDLAPAVYYDLSGRQVENPAEGIYIVNGKKVVL